MGTAIIMRVAATARPMVAAEVKLEIKVQKLKLVLLQNSLIDGGTFSVYCKNFYTHLHSLRSEPAIVPAPSATHRYAFEQSRGNYGMMD